MNGPHALRIQAVLNRLGWPGLVGVLMGAVGAWGAWQVLPAWRIAAEEDEAQVLHLRRQLQQQAERGAPMSAGAQARSPAAAASVPDEATPALVHDSWARSWASLPTPADAVERQSAVMAQAVGLGVSVASVQYRGGALSSLPSVWRQQMVLPVEATYPALRAWLGGVLQDRAVSLDSLDVVRADPMGDQVKARVALSVWWRQEAR